LASSLDLRGYGAACIEMTLLNPDLIGILDPDPEQKILIRILDPDPEQKI
jgi:hypothetical protein